MTKGVNKQVIEIRETGNEYFEKALLFVKPEYSTMSRRSLEEKISGVFAECRVPECRRSRIKAALRTAVAALLSAAAGALITALIK